jgi:uncharacterized membrane protein
MSARRRVGTSILPGVVVGAGVGFVSQQWDVAALAGWDAAGITFLVWTWRKLWRLDQAGSRRDAEREDPTQALADGILLVAALVSLAAVAVVLATGQSSKGAGLLVNLALAVGSVVVSWAVVHTTFTVKYARLYYSGADGGIDFHDPSSKATYQDFAYLAFTVGMTFQVSDTEINSREIRATVLRHALIAYLFGAVILAATINLLAGLSK